MSTAARSRAGEREARSVVGILGISLLVLSLAMILWVAGELTGLLWHHHWPASRPEDAVGVLLRTVVEHPSAPNMSWLPPARADVPGALPVYGVAILLVGLTGAAVTAAAAGRRRRTGRGAPLRWWTRLGHASRLDVRRALSPRAIRRSATVVRPSVADPARADIHELGVDLGRTVTASRPLVGTLEDSYLLLGPPRCGKGVSFLTPALVRFPGPALYTSTRDDAFRHTALASTRPGPLFLFDPTHVCAWPERMRWSPVTGCEDPLVAILRARALVAGSGAGKNVTNGDFWAGAAEVVLRCYLHAAAVGGRDMRAVRRWVAQQQSSEPAALLRDRAAAEGWAADLAGVIQAPDQTRGSIFATVALALAVLADPRVLDACCPDDAHPAFECERFLDERGTLYLVGHTGAQLSMAPLITALVESIVDTARRRAARSSGGRLDPPLGLFLDEAAQIAPLPSLPNLVADGGGSGITTFTVLQSLSQARHRWGDAAAEALWDASTARLVFRGLGNDRDLERISRLCGDVDETTRSRTRGVDGRSTWTESPRRMPTLSVAQIRNLPQWHALLLYRGLRPIEVWLPGWWDRPTYAATVTAARDAMESRMRASGARPSPEPA